MQMPFGKHKGKQIHELDHNYLQWAVENLTRCPAVIAEAKRVLAGGTTPEISPATAAKMNNLIFKIAEQVRKIDEQAQKIRGLEFELELERQLASPSFSIPDFDAWYKKMVLLVHPDRGGDPEAMKLVNDLKDKVRK